jgi:transposase
MLGEGLSLAEIGRRLERHESTVSYWVDRHVLRANGHERHAARGALAKDRLEALVEAGMSTSEIAAAMERSKTSVRHWLRKHGLKTRRSAGSRPREATVVARAQGLSEVLLSCPRHGEVCHVRDGRGSFRCRRCRAEAVVRRRRRVKQILVEEAGGRCRLCGYDGSPVPSSSITLIRARRSSGWHPVGRQEAWTEFARRSASASCCALIATRRSRRVSVRSPG